ncbi:MAG: NAD(P)-dependent oxidoreductase [Calditrichaeota bacterium]|nr:NAD(P)-dependent oxidoreductase [Calditrichota bacterium]
MNKRPSPLPIIVVTGASGFIGRHFVNNFCNEFYMYCIGRRSQRAAAVTEHENICWIRQDIAEEAGVKKIFSKIAKNGGADFVLHLAGYYDFDNEEHPEFERTNINGTKYILDNTGQLNIKRFIYTSSLTVSEFTKPGTILNEKSPADATFPYAISKRICEEMILEYSYLFPSSIIRLAAIFSDWCEYGPLYMFLTGWFSNSWKARILAGKGESAVPYLHVSDVNRFINLLIKQSTLLPDYQIYVVSPDGCSTHKELYSLAMRYNFTNQAKPFFIPKGLAAIVVLIKDVFGKLIGKRPFERPWMIKYINQKMVIDASLTRKMLSWKPTGRYHINRRLLFLIENMKSNPYEWNRRNYEAIYKKGEGRPNLAILDAMLLLEEEIITKILMELTSKKYKQIFKTYQSLQPQKLKERIEVIYEILKRAIRSGDRMHIMPYANNLAIERIKENFEVQEVIQAIIKIGNVIVFNLLKHPPLQSLQPRIHDEINLTIQLIADEVEDTYERLTGFSAG